MTARKTSYKAIAADGTADSLVYIAHFSDDIVRRMSFWSKAGKPIDHERGKRLCMSVEPGRHFVYGEVSVGGKVTLADELPAMAKPRVSNVKVRKLALSIVNTAKTGTDNHYAIIPAKLLNELRQELAA